MKELLWNLSNDEQEVVQLESTMDVIPETSHLKHASHHSQGRDAGKCSKKFVKMFCSPIDWDFWDRSNISSHLLEFIVLRVDEDKENNEGDDGDDQDKYTTEHASVGMAEQGWSGNSTLSLQYLQSTL